MKLKLISAALLLASAALHAQTVEVHNAWVRATVKGQQGTGAFMSLTAKDGAQLVGVSTPVAGVAEIHEMKMDGDVMKMRAMPSLVLPAGKTVELKPGGIHLMLMDLKQAIAKDSKVPLSLHFKDGQGVMSQQEITVPASVVAPGAAAKAGDKPAQHGAHAH